MIEITLDTFFLVTFYPSVADPERFDKDPDPTFQADADPDPAPDPDPNPFTRVKKFFFFKSSFVVSKVFQNLS